MGIITGDDAFAADLGASLEALGVAVRRIALENTARTRCQLAVLDLDTDARGLEAVSAAVRAGSPHARLVAVGTEPDRTVLLRLLRSGAFDCIERPIATDALAEQLHNLYERSQFGRMSGEVTRRLKTRESAANLEALHGEVVRSNEELQIVNRRLQKVVSQIKTLYHMGRDLADNENWSDALDRFLMALVNFMEADGAALLLFSFEESCLQPRSMYQIDGDALDDACQRILSGWKAHPRSREIHPLASYEEERPASCLERTGEWRYTLIPLRHRSQPFGYLLLDKSYRDGFDFKGDFDFLNTLQTMFAEEIANASYISELRQLGRFNNKVLDNIRSGVVTTDASGQVRYANVWAEEMCPHLRALGRRGSEPVRFDSLFESHQFAEGMFTSMMDSGHDSHVLEVQCRAGEKEVFPARLRTTKMFDDNLNGTVLVAIFEDLTEQKRMESEIRRNDRLRVLGQLSAGVAHEIRNPLTGIANCAEVLGSKLGEDPDRQKYVRAMLDEIHRLDGIIRNLLTFARPPRPQLGRCDVGGVVERVAMLLGDQAAERNVRLEVGVRESGLVCRADGAQLTQVLMNLVLNAIQACEPGGEVRVGTKSAPATEPAGAADVARIDVIDDGPGVPSEVRESLFEPFVTTKTRGTGLGLAISQQIIEDHEGSISCDFLERGTRFSIELPRLSSNRTAPGAASAGATTND